MLKSNRVLHFREMVPNHFLFISFVLDAVYSVFVLLAMVVIPMTIQAQVGSV